MKMVRAKEFIEEYFDESSRPTMKTVREWVRLKHVPGQMIGSKRTVYVDVDAFNEANRQIGPVYGG